MKKLLIIVIIIFSLFLGIFLQWDYIKLYYGISKSVVSNNGTREINNTNFIIEYLESKQNFSTEKYIYEITKIQKTLDFAWVKFNLKDILKLNAELSENLLCKNIKNIDNEEIVNYCENSKLEKNIKNINENYNCSQFTQEKAKINCQNYKNNILNINSFDYCSAIDCKIMNIIFWTNIGKTKIGEGCSLLKNQVFFDTCLGRYKDFLEFKKWIKSNEYYEKILSNKDLDEVEKAVYLSVYWEYSAVPEKNCESLKEEVKIKKCENLYKEVISYIEKRKYYLQYQNIINKSNEKNPNN